MKEYIKKIKKADPELAALIEKEEAHHRDTLNLIASENYPSLAVRAALSSIFIVKYSEGRPGKRYYGGMENIDALEKLAEKRALNLFLGKESEKWAVNLQPLSGSPANYEVYRGLLKPGAKIMSLSLDSGGHLSHGAPVSLTEKDFKISRYFLDRKTETLDYRQIEALAKKEKPDLIICGYSAYPRKVDFKKFGQIARKSGAYLLADISHIAGLVVANQHLSPFPWADIVTTTTHKTLRGPRGAMIICRQNLKDKIFPSVFPGLQGGPHNHTIAGTALAFEEASKPAFKKYARQVVENGRVLAMELKKYGFRLVSGGTDNHLLLIDLSSKRVSGSEAQEVLEKGGIIVNKNMIPYDKKSPKDPSGIRLGTPAVTSRGMEEKEMKAIAGWINVLIDSPRQAAGVKKEIRKLCRKFWTEKN